MAAYPFFLGNFIHAHNQILTQCVPLLTGSKIQMISKIILCDCCIASNQKNPDKYYETKPNPSHR